jgi:hypothetical protein
MVDEGRVRSLTEYLHHAQELGSSRGEAGHLGTRNLVGETLREQQIEMLATASAAPRVEYPMVHIIVSWRAGEVPTPAQVDEAVDILLTTAGLDRSAALHAEHVNTDSRHVHVAALRIDKATGAAAAANGSSTICIRRWPSSRSGKDGQRSPMLFTMPAMAPCSMPRHDALSPARTGAATRAGHRGNDPRLRWSACPGPRQKRYHARHAEQAGWDSRSIGGQH